MKVIYANACQRTTPLKDLKDGATFIIEDIPETAIVYLKIEPMGVYNCINLNTGKPGFIIDTAAVFPIDAELKWKYQEP